MLLKVAGALCKRPTLPDETFSCSKQMLTLGSRLNLTNKAQAQLDHRVPFNISRVHARDPCTKITENCILFSTEPAKGASGAHLIGDYMQTYVQNRESQLAVRC